MRYKSKVYPKSSISWGHHYLHEIKDGKAVRIQDQKSPAPLRYRLGISLGPRADSKTPPAGKLVTRVSTARIRRRRPQTRNGAALATPSYSLVPPGGFENSPRGEIGDAGVDGPNPPAAPTNQKRRRSRDAVIFPGAPGRIRTVDTRFRRAVLYPLSYGGMLY